MLKYGATKVDAEFIIAQISSQCKLATLRSENRKIQTNKQTNKQTCSRSGVKIY
jgi:hypothetical protein